MSNAGMALGAPITQREKAICQLPFAAHSKFARLDDFKPLAQALVRQYVDTVENLQQVLEGSFPRHLPDDIRWTKQEGTYIFSSASGNYSAQLDDQGHLLLRRGGRQTSFRMDRNRGGDLKLVRTVYSRCGVQRVVKHAEVCLEQGSRSQRIEGLSSPASGNSAPGFTRIKMRTSEPSLQPLRFQANSAG